MANHIGFYVYSVGASLFLACVFSFACSLSFGSPFWNRPDDYYLCFPCSVPASSIRGWRMTFSIHMMGFLRQRSFGTAQPALKNSSSESHPEP